MSRLVPNPIAELHAPLKRIEDAILGLTTILAPLEHLAPTRSELVKVNKRLAAMQAGIDGLREDLAVVRETQTVPAATNGRG